ncbi:unnamed protein product [Phyllotreta striolata]|uniref:TRASH domain-containing protein n=1 Tax=Phyllotreta striolata TaxID=444603 RepID=A0A9N9THQ9_PHYSR|nr:unnamed protein product [Phyllotreta striolata]
MEEYNSEVLKTVEDLANNIPMDINVSADVYKSTETPNENDSKLSNAPNESTNDSGQLDKNTIENEDPTPEESTAPDKSAEECNSISNKEADSEETAATAQNSTDVPPISTSDSEKVVDTVSETGKEEEAGETVPEKMDWTESEKDPDKVPENDNDTSKNSNEKPSENEPISENSLNDSKEIDDAEHDKPIISTESEEPVDPPPAESQDTSSDDKETPEPSASVTTTEDLLEAPSENNPELEDKKAIIDSTVDMESKSPVSKELQSEDITDTSPILEDDKIKKPIIEDEVKVIEDNDDLISKSKATNDDSMEIECEELDKDGNDKEKQSDRENTEFVHVTENEKESDDIDKDSASGSRRDMEHDPIASDSFESLNNEDREGADEELCIIPDTEREISQEERDAASSITPLRDISEATVSIQPEENNQEVPEQTSPSPIVIFKYEMDDLQICNECKLKRKVKYYYSVKDDIDADEKYLCDENCLNTFKSSQSDKIALNWEEGGLRVKDFSGVSKESTTKDSTLVRKCAMCSKQPNEDEILIWEIKDFCNEFCLIKYQKEIGSFCSTCKGEVNSNSLGKYCVRFGTDIRQFCSSLCLDKYKKGLKVCSYCQQDMSGGAPGFLAPVGDKGIFKDFCSRDCMEKYDVMTNNKPPIVPAGTTCSVCKAEKPITIEYELDRTTNYFCGEPCFVAFSFVNNISPGKCGMCRRHFPKDTLEKHTMYYDNIQLRFCSASCENIYIIAHRKIVPCSWCKVKKYNFDMIRKHSNSDTIINMCSVNCLTLYRVSVEAVSLKQATCSLCQKFTLPMYHLTMSDATLRNFCSYICVLNFQNQYSKPSNRSDSAQPVPTGQPRRNKQNTETDSVSIQDINQLPVITSVQSLASNGNMAQASAVPSTISSINTRSTRSKSSNSSSQAINSFSDAPFQVQIKQHFIVRPAPIPEQRNVGTMCYTRKLNKGTSARPVMVDQEVQTDEREEKKILIPVPVPIYVPTPMHMYSIPTPVPVPIPLPIPIPIFIPTTRNSAAGIMKEIKKIQVKIPTDPYEAELLMMAEMVAEEKKEDITDSESDVDDAGGPDDGYSPEPVDASNTFGDDMLQMALKMATELDEPPVDLEGALTANTITAPQGGEAHPVGEENVDDQQPMHHHMMGDRNPAIRGRKRGMRQPRSGAKRGRRMSHHQVDMPMMPHHQVQQPPPPPEPAEKPDANMCLKYTFGVNAWKQWVTTKNAELEKSSRLVKLFKTEILQLTADELNYSLCLFVKEVRKPNGAEYAPDTIYYLCLGIQQYLFENGRIDNIFCDAYYEKFTDCLDEVAKKFSVLYNDSHYIVTRVEEEHLWESKQLGAHSPHVLLSTLMFFNTKHFNLTSVDEHMQLSFSHIMKHWKRNPNQPGASKVPGSRNVLLRFYPPQSAIQNNARKKKVYEQQENEENPLRCPVKLYEFYLSKCPESVKTRNDVFYLQPERSCVPDSPVWYSTMPLPKEALEKMLHRVKMVKEINVALLTS